MDEKKFLSKRTSKEKKESGLFCGVYSPVFFPEVPKAAVEVFQHNGIEVYFPEQKCCGMPSMLEGDRQLTLGFVQLNIDRLAEAIQDGYDMSAPARPAALC
ncbi:MAG: hypothetical protein JSW26_03625 [Desulfobacterales bacterium]|nr:MAG: hypothetical protein JSW26_03625 [Desulfobacterales bacterium]